MSNAEQVARVQAALRATELEGWLFFDFRGQNPIATAMLGLGWTSRRSFTLVPSEGDPVTLIHAIEHSSWRHWPWGITRLRWVARHGEPALGVDRRPEEAGHGGFPPFECSHLGQGAVPVSWIYSERQEWTP